MARVSMNQGIAVILPVLNAAEVDHAAGTKAVLPPRFWTSSAVNSRIAPVAAKAPTQLMSTCMTSGPPAPAPVSAERILV